MALGLVGTTCLFQMLAGLVLVSVIGWPAEVKAEHVGAPRISLETTEANNSHVVSVNGVVFGPNELPPGYSRRCRSTLSAGGCLRNEYEVVHPDGRVLGLDRDVFSNHQARRVPEGVLGENGLLDNGRAVFTTFTAPTPECRAEAAAAEADPDAAAIDCPMVLQTSASQGVWEDSDLNRISACCDFAYAQGEGPPNKLSGVFEQSVLERYDFVGNQLVPVFRSVTSSDVRWSGPFVIDVTDGMGPRYQACMRLRRDVTVREYITVRCTAVVFEILEEDGQRTVGHISTQVRALFYEVVDVEPPVVHVGNPSVGTVTIDTYEGRSHSLTGIGVDPDGDTVTTFRWSRLATNPAGLAGVAIHSPSAATSGFTMPEVAAPGGQVTQIVRLTGTDNAGLSGTDDVRFVIRDTSPPDAHAGFDQQVTVSSTGGAPNRFTLDAGLSRDARGGNYTDRLEYTWEEVTSPASNVLVEATLVPGGRAGGARVTLDVPTTETTHHFRVTVRDVFTLGEDTDWVTIIVRPPASLSIAVTGTIAIGQTAITPLPSTGTFNEGAIVPFVVSVPETALFSMGNVTANWRILFSGVNPLEVEEIEIIPADIVTNGVTIQIRGNNIGGTLELRPGRTSVRLPFTVLDDPLNESPETLTLELSNVRNVVNAASALRYTVTVAPSDPITYFMGTDPNDSRTMQYPVEEDGGGATVDVAVSLSRPSEGRLILGANLSGTAIAGTNTEVAIATTGVLTTVFEPLQTTGTFRLNIVDDDETESIETITLTLREDSRPDERVGVVSRTDRRNQQAASVRINESDFRMTLGFRSDYTLTEGASTQACVSVVSPVLADFRRNKNVYLAVTPVFDINGLAVAADIGLSRRTLGPFNKEQMRHCFTLTAIEDAIPENTERLTLSLATTPGPDTTVPGGHVSLQSAASEVTIMDNDPIVIGWEQEFVTAGEGGQAATLAAAIISPADDMPITRDNFFLGVTTVADSATSGTDFIPATAARLRLDFGAARRRVVITNSVPLAVVDDGLNEAAETFRADLVFLAGQGIGESGIDAATSADSLAGANQELTYGLVENVVIRESSRSAVIHIPANDPAVIGILPAASPVTEGRTAVFEVQMSLPSQGVVTATYTVSGAGPGDYEDQGASTGAARIAAGTTTAQIRLRILDDGEDDSGEMLTVRLTAVEIGAGAGQIIIHPALTMSQIVTPDQQPLSAPVVADVPETANVSEGAATTFTVQVSRATGTPADAALRYDIRQVVNATVDTVVAPADPNHAPVANPAGAVPADGNITVRYTAPSVTSQIAVVFRVIATVSREDYRSSSAVAVHTVTVRDTAPPAVQAGGDFPDAVEGAAATLAGTGADPDGDAVTFLWSQPPGEPAVVFANTASAATGVTWPNVDAGTTRGLTLTLTVSDSIGLTATDSLRVVVRDSTAPTARAGDDQTLITGEEVTLDGGASLDARAESGAGQLSYSWRQTDASGAALSPGDASRVELTTAAAAATTFSAPLAAATLYFELTVTDTVTRRAATDGIAVTLEDPVGRSLSVGFAQPRVDEGATLTFVVRLGRTEEASDGNVGVDWIVTGTGVNNSVSAEDFADANGVALGGFPTGAATIAAGAHTVIVGVPTFDDGMDENAEGWNVVLLNPRGGRLGAVASQTGVINSSDAVAPPPAPIANAGADREVAEGVVVGGELAPATILLPATASRADGDDTSDFLTYRWTQTDADGNPLPDDSDAAVQLTGADTTLASFSAPNVAVTAAYTFRFTATAGRGGLSASSSDLVTISVRDAQPPVAAAFSGVSEVVENTATMLTGAASSDPDGLPVTFEWGPEQSLFNSVTAAVTEVIWPDVPSGASRSFTVTLTVTDAGGLTATDSLRVLVLDGTPPVVDPGMDRTVFVGDAVVLDGGNSRSARGGDTTAGLSFLWQQMDSNAPGATVLAPGDPGYVLTSIDTAATRFTAPSFGPDEQAYFFRLTVTDLISASRGSLSAPVVITVRKRPLSAFTTAPIAPQSVPQGQSVALAGVAARDMGATPAIVSYQWVQTGGDRVQLSGADRATAVFTAPDVYEPTEYRFVFTATARRYGYITTVASATAVVTVNDTEVPVVTLPAGLTDALEQTSATITGTVSDPDNDPNLRYLWRQIAPDPNGGLSIAIASPTTTTTTLTYPDIPAQTGIVTFTLELRATDSQGLVGTTVTTVTVRDGSPPTVGPFDIPDVVARNAAVILNASASRNLSGTREDLAYQWVQIEENSPGAAVLAAADPRVVVLTDAATPVARFTAPSTTTFLHFRFTVTNTLTRQSDTVQGTVQVKLNASRAARGVYDRYTGAYGYINDSFVVSERAVARLRVATGFFGFFERTLLRHEWEQVDRNDAVLALPLPSDHPNYAQVATPSPDFAAFPRSAGDPATWSQTDVTMPDVDRPTTLYIRYTAVSYGGQGLCVAFDVATGCGGEHPDYAPTRVSRIYTILVHDATPPDVEAGLDIEIDEGEERRLSASATDPAGSRVDVEWTQSPALPPVIFSDRNATNTTIRIVNVQRGTSGTINLTLTGTDLQGLRRSDSLVVTYRSGARARASAGPDQALYVPSGGAIITLDGRGSLAARASLDEVSSSERLQYSWQQVAGDFVDAPAVGSTSPAFVTLFNANTARPQFAISPPAAGTAVFRYFRLTVTDIVTGGRDSDVVAITANPVRLLDAFLLNDGYALANTRSTEGEVRFVYLLLNGGLNHSTTVSVNWTLGPPTIASRAAAQADDFCPAAGRRSQSNAWPNNAYPGGTVEFPVGARQLLVPFYACVDDSTEPREYYDVIVSSLNDPTGGTSFPSGERANRSVRVGHDGNPELLLAGQFIVESSGRPVLGLIPPPGILGCERQSPDWVVQLNEEQQRDVSAAWLLGIAQSVNPNIPPVSNALGLDFFDGTRPINGENPASYSSPEGFLSSRITIPVGETTAAISIQYRDDGIIEENEYYAMLLHSPSTGVIFQPGYTSNVIGNLAGILSDAEPAGVVTPTPAATVEPAPLPANPAPTDLTYVRFPIVLDRGRTTTTRIIWGIGGDATYQGDYVGISGFGVVPESLQSGSVLFQSEIRSGTTSVIAEFILLPDELNEPDETITLILANGCGAPGGAGARVTHTIVDDDPINILLQGPQAPLAEGASATFTLSIADGKLPSTTLTVPWSLNPVAGTSLTVPWSSRPVVATSATSVDFVNLPSLPLTGTATFAAGESVWQLNLRIGLDRLTEPSLQGFEFVINTATVTGAFGEVGVVSGSAIVAAIAADPVPYILPIITSPTTVIEGSPATPTVLFVLSDPSGPVTSNLTLRVDYALDGTATFNTDYEIAGDPLQIQRRPNLPNGTVVFAPGTSLALIGFSPTDDDVNEVGENVLITLNNPRPSNEVQLLPSLPLRQASFTIQDNDTVVVTAVAQNPSSVLEPSSSIDPVIPVTFDVGISGGTLQHRLRVSYTLNGTATPDVDYNCRPRTTCSGVGTLDFSPGPGGNMTATVTLNILGDDISETAENVFVSLTAAWFDGAAGAVFLDNPARPSATTIRNDSSDIVYIEPVSLVEAESTGSVLVSFTGVGGGVDATVPNIDATATVTYRLRGTAVMGAHYDTPPGYAGRRGTFTLPPGWPGVEAGVTIPGVEAGVTIPLLHDGLNQTTRTVIVILTEVAADRSDVRLRLGDPARTAVLSIRDIDPIVVSLVSSPSAPRLLEGDVWQFDIEAGGGVPTADVQVDLAVVRTGVGHEADASDVVNGDSLTVTIPMDQRSARASIVLRPDSTREPNETLTVRLAGGRSTGEVRLSEVRPTTASTVIQADGFVYGIFDFGHSANIVNIAEGAQANAAIRVFEPHAGAPWALNLSVPYTIYPEFSDVSQGGSIADYSVRLPAGGAGPVGTATSNAHGYTSVGVIGNSDFQRTNINRNTILRIDAIDDCEVEGDERFRLELEDPIDVQETNEGCCRSYREALAAANVSDAQLAVLERCCTRFIDVLGNTAVADVTRDDFYITILDNDRADIFMELAGDPDEFTEGTATVNVNFVVTGGSVASPFEGRYILEGCGVNPATGQPYCTAGFQTISNSDVGRSSLTSIDIASGSTESKDTLVVSSNVPDNNWNEPDHTVVTVGWRHELASLPGSIRSRITLGNTTETVVLRDDDDITVDIAATSLRVDRGATVTFVVTLSGASSGSRGVITLPYEDASTVAREDITPAFSSADATVPGRLVIPPGETTGVIVLRLADNVAGSFADLVVTLLEPQVGPGGGRVALAAAASARVEVAPAVFRVDAVTVDRDAAAPGTQVHEGDTATFVVTPEGDRPSDDTVIVWTVGGDVEPADYTPASGTLTFAPASWGTSQTVQIGIADDTLNESTETLTLLLGNAVGGIGVQVVQSDPIAYDTEDITVAEGAIATVIVRLSGLSEGDVTVPFTVSGTATAGLDYTAITATAVTIAAGATTAAVSAPILRDNLNEASETIVLELGEAVMTTAIGMVARATTSVAVVIADLNLLNAAITSRQDRVDEDNPVYFDVTLSGGMATAPVMVPFTLRGVADADDDYHIALPLGQCAADTTGTLTIAAGTTAGLVALWIAHEFVTEEDEMLSVTIGTPQTAGLAGVTAAMAGVVIPANDPPPEAAAGVDQVVDMLDEVTLSATASVIVATDSNGPLRYQWQQVAADSADAGVIAADDERFVPLSGAASDVATFTAPERAGGLYFRVTVTDNMTGNSDTDEVAVTVRGPRLVNISDTAENSVSAVNEGTTMTFRIVLGDRDRDASDGTDRVDWAVAAVGDYPAEAGDFADAEGNALTNFPSGTAVIPADEFETRVDLRTWNDTALEGTETFVIRISNPLSQGSPVGVGLSSSLTGTILDDEVPGFTIVAADATVDEGNDAVFTVTPVGSPPTSDQPVPFTVTGVHQDDFSVTAPSGIVMNALQSTLTFPANAASARIELEITDDNINEDAETLRLAFGEAGGGYSADVTIPRNDAVFLHVLGGREDWFTGQYGAGANLQGPVAGRGSCGSVDPTYELAEGTTATFSVVLGNEDGTVSYRSAADISAVWHLEQVSAGGRANSEAAPDFAFVGGGVVISAQTSALTARVTIPAGSTQADITFSILQDGIVESNLPAYSGEIARLYLQSGSAEVGSGAGEVTLATLLNCAAYLHIEARMLTVTGPDDIPEMDSNTTRSYTVVLTGTPFSDDTLVTWRLTTGTRIGEADAADFMATTGTVAFSSGDPGGAATNFTVTVIGDNLNETTETFIVRATVPDPDADGGTRYFDERIAGEVSDDGVVLARRIGTVAVTIADDDPITATVIGGGNVSEGQLATATVVLTGAELSVPATVDYAIGVDGDPATVDAAATADYERGPGSLEIAAGASSGTIALHVLPDGLNEASEVFVVTVGAVSAVGVIHFVESTHTFTILDGDDITVSFADTSVSIEEGQTVELVVNLNKPSAAQLTVPYSVTAGGVNPPPFTDNTGSPLVFAAGATSMGISLASDRSDTLNASTGTLTLTLDAGAIGAGVGAGVVTAGGPAVATVTFREFSREFSVVADAADIVEGDRVVFTVTLAGLATRASSVTWTISGDVDGADYTTPTAASGVLEFDGTGLQTIHVDIDNDALSETTETLTLSLSDVRSSDSDIGIGAAAAAATVIIAASDPITVAIAADRARLAESGTATFTVTLDGGRPGTPLEVPFSVMGGVDADDYDIVLPGGLAAHTTMGILTIAVEETSGRIVLRVPDDNLAEGEEALTVVLDEPQTAGSIDIGTASATVTIESSVRLPEVSLSGPGVVGVEGSSQTWIVQLDPAHRREVEVEYRIAGTGGADSVVAGDFTDAQGMTVASLPLTGSVTIAIGMTETAITLYYRNDDDDEEGEERFEVSLTGFVGDPGVLFATTLDIAGPERSSGSVVNIAGVEAGVTAAAESAAEGTSAVFTIALSGVQSQATTVHWTLGGDAQRGVDYTGDAIAGQPDTMRYQSVIAAGSTRADVVFSLTDDMLNESSETLVMTIVLTGGVRPGADASARYAILDNDAMVVRLSGPAEAVSEGATATFTITLGRLPTRMLSVPWRVTGTSVRVSAEADDFADFDMLPFAGAATFAAGATTTVVNIMIGSDRTVESDEQFFEFTVGADEVTGAYGEVGVVGSPVMSSIAADAAAAVTLTALQESVDEAGVTSPTFLITLGDDAGPLLSGADVSLSYMLTGTAVSGEDYAGASAGSVLITGGSSGTRLVLALVNDVVNESTESITLSLGGAEATIHIEDDDVITGTVDAPSSALLEGATATFTITIGGGSLSAGTILTIPWRITTSSSAADDDVAPADFGLGRTVFPSGSVSFVMGESEKATSAIGIVEDGLGETTETFVLVLGEPSGAAGVTSLRGVSASATIAASSESLFQFTAMLEDADQAAVEEATTSVNIIVGVEATGGAQRSTLSVSYSLSGTATPGADYEVSATTGTVVFGVGETMRTIELGILPDIYAESTESIVLSLSDPVLGDNPGAVAVGAPSSATVLIRPGQRLGISLQSPSQLTEGAAAAVVSMEAADMARFEATATLTYTLGGTAVAGVDYSVPQGYANSSGTVTLPPDWPNTSSPGLNITPIDDGDNESTETIVVTISDVAIEGGYWRIETGSVVLRLVDDDALTVSLQGPDSAAAEGGNADFTVVLSGSTPTADVMVDYEIVPGGGIEASDIDGALTGVITIGVGSMSEAIAIPIADDTVPESTETLTVMLTAGRSAGVVEVSQAGIAAVVERSDVAGIAVIAASTTRTEGQSAVFDLQFVSAGGAALSLGEIGGATSALVSWTLGGAATAGADYTGATTGATQVPFNTTASVTVVLTDDEVNESDETVVLTLNDVRVNGASLDYLELSASSGSATVVVADNDDAMVSVERAGADTSPVNEGDEVMFHINLDVESQGAVEVPFTIGGVGVTTQDYALADTMFSVTLSPGSTRATIALTVLPDGMAETTETLVVSLQPPRPDSVAGRVTLGAAATAEVAIRENAATTLFYEIDAVDAVVAEGATATFNIALVNEVDGGVNTDTTVMYSITGMVEREDYAADMSGTLTFTPSDWQTAQRVVIPLLSDNLNESSETLTLQLSSPSGGAQEAPALRGAGRASVMIAESDPITYSIEGPGRVGEGEDAMFTVILSGAVSGSEGAVTVPYTIAADEGDYAGPLSGAETLGVGTTSTVIMVPTVEDAVNESTGMLVVTLGAASEADFMKDAAAGVVTRDLDPARHVATAMIEDNDALTVSVSPPATMASEGTNVVLDVILSGAASGSAASIEVPYSVSTAAAAAAGITTDDYATTPTSPLTIDAGATTGTITVSIEYDGMEEDAETLTVVLGNPEVVGTGGGAVALSSILADRSASITIPENTTSVRVLTITGTGVVAEGDAEVSVEYTMGLMGTGFAEARNVTWEVVHGTTTATDFSGATSGMVSLGPSAATASFTVGIAGDSLNEATEIFSIEASVEDSVSDGSTDSGDPFAVSVSDDDELTVSVLADTAGVSEGATASFTLTLDGGMPTADVDVSFTLGGSAEGEDYTAAASPLTIAAGTTSGELMLPIDTDNLNESTETLTVELTGAVNMPSAGSIVLGTTMTEVSIAQSDAAEVVLARTSGEEASEGGTAEFVLTLDTPSADVVTVTWMASVITQTNTGTGDRGPNEADNSDFRAGVNAAITSGAIVGTTVVEMGNVTSAFSIGIAQDRREEDAESVVIRIIGVSAGTGAGEVSASSDVARLTIPANLAATRFLSVSANQETIEEGMDAQFTVELSGVDDPTADVTVDWSVVGGGANPAEADDYTATTGSLSFSGFESQVVSVSIRDDGLNESAETLVVMLENADGGGNPSAVISTASAEVVVGQSDPKRIQSKAPAGSGKARSRCSPSH